MASMLTPTFRYPLAVGLGMLINVRPNLSKHLYL